MKGFVEITDKEDNMKMLLPVEKIVNIEVCPNGQVWLNMFVKPNGELFGVPTVESFDEIKQRLALAGV